MISPRFFGKAVQELGIKHLSYYGAYWLGLHSSYYRMVTPAFGKSGVKESDLYTFQPVFPFPDKEQLISIIGKTGQQTTVDEAEEICNGRVRLFGGEPVPLELAPDKNPSHWTDYILGKRSLRGVQEPMDWKLVWEHGRFGWVYPLGRAYLITGEEKYADAFWEYAEAFLEANPANQGPHWMSAQEVAIRLMALVFGLGAFRESAAANQRRITAIAEAIAQHASRIPPTLVYARAQRNNHLLTEAAGLLTAGYALPSHPSASEWRLNGWRWMNRALLDQIAEDGSYIQQSNNYHRLMLQTALWVNAVVKDSPPDEGSPSKESKAGALAIPPLLMQKSRSYFPQAASERLAKSTAWLADLLEAKNGQVPNLGPNDGAYLFPLTSLPFHDYRPVLQAASIAFRGKRLLPAGTWDEMTLWFLGQDAVQEIDEQNYLGVLI